VNPIESAEPLLTVQDVARIFNVPVSWVYAKAEAGDLAHHHIGRYLRFRASDLELYLAAQRRGGEAK
jgi:excisionase family DNA binding protein